MNDIQAVYDAYSFMRLDPKDTVDQIRRQYKDLMILWHPDKHYNDQSKYTEYENLTKQLTAAYQKIIDYLNTNENLPPRGASKKEDKEFNLFDIPNTAYEPLSSSPYYPDLGVSGMIETAVFNGIGHSLNLIQSAMGVLDKLTTKWRIENIDALVKSIKQFKVHRNTVRFGTVSYSRKVDFAVVPFYNESWLSRVSSNVSYLSNTGRYIDYLNANAFCGIENWRMISAEDLYALFCFGKSMGYDVGDGKLYTGYDGYEYTYQLHCDLNGKFVHIKDLSHVPCNGGKFKDFLLKIGFYCIDKRYCYYEHAGKVFKLDIESCSGSDLSGDGCEPFLWPVSDDAEGLVTACITHVNAEDNPAVSNATKNRALEEALSAIKIICGFLMAPVFFVGGIVLVCAGALLGLWLFWAIMEAIFV